MIEHDSKNHTPTLDIEPANNDHFISLSDIPNSVRICLDQVDLTEMYPNPIVEKSAVYFVFTIAA